MATVTYVLAICEGPTASERFWGIALPLLGAAIFIGVLSSAIRGSGRTGSLAILFVLAGVLGALIISTPGGLSDSDGDYLARAFTALIAGLILGGVWAALARVNALRAIVAGGLGGVAPIVWLVGLLFFWLAAADTCLD
jgi:drug/metabolite transporter (DMT)-like permease